MMKSLSDRKGFEIKKSECEVIIQRHQAKKLSLERSKEDNDDKLTKINKTMGMIGKTYNIKDKK